MSEAYKQHGAFGWSELLVNDIDNALDFYSKVIGWEVEQMDMPSGAYYILKAGGEPVGGIMKKTDEVGQKSDIWGTYITVDNVDETLAAAKAVGGKEMYPPLDIRGVAGCAHLAIRAEQ
jgi:predicted enzyme related to lactoylglutathione lyase